MSSPKKSNVRPTTDKVRSAVFSILGKDVMEASVLDLFAGTGSFGIEAVSRGAKFSTFVDVDTRLLGENISLLEKGSYQIKRGDCFKVLGRLDESFDIIFADPPYGIYPPEKLLDVISKNNLLANNGFLIYEESARTMFNFDNSMFDVLDFRKYGESAIHILRQVL